MDNGEARPGRFHQMTSCGLRWAVASSAAPGRTTGTWYRSSMVLRGLPAGVLRPYQVELDMGNLIFAPDELRDWGRHGHASSVDGRAYGVVPLFQTRYL